jgi:hypothetical protein
MWETRVGRRWLLFAVVWALVTVALDQELGWLVLLVSFVLLQLVLWLVRVFARRTGRPLL